MAPPKSQPGPGAVSPGGPDSEDDYGSCRWRPGFEAPGGPWCRDTCPGLAPGPAGKSGSGTKEDPVGGVGPCQDVPKGGSSLGLFSSGLPPSRSARLPLTICGVGPQRWLLKTRGGPRENPREGSAPPGSAPLAGGKRGENPKLPQGRRRGARRPGGQAPPAGAKNGSQGGGNHQGDFPQGGLQDPWSCSRLSTIFLIIKIFSYPSCLSWFSSFGVSSFPSYQARAQSREDRGPGAGAGGTRAPGNKKPGPGWRGIRFGGKTPGFSCDFRETPGSSKKPWGGPLAMGVFGFPEKLAPFHPPGVPSATTPGGLRQRILAFPGGPDNSRGTPRLRRLLAGNRHFLKGSSCFPRRPWPLGAAAG